MQNFVETYTLTTIWDRKIILRQNAMTRGELRMLIRISWGPSPIACFITANCSKVGLRKSKSMRKIFTFYFPKLKGIFRSSELLTSQYCDFHWPDKKWHWLLKLRNWQNLRSNFRAQLKLLRVICWDLYSVLLFTFLLTTVFPLALLFITLSTK